jgi:4-hydroxybenzoate polyprenyltransferase
MQLTAVRTKDTTARGTDPAARGKDATAPAGRTGVRDANGMAVASFILGLVGLLVLNVVLGPIAIALAAVALWRGTTRRGRALLGLGLGVADLVLLVTFMQLDHTVSWSF